MKINLRSTDSPPLKVMNRGQLNGLIEDHKDDGSLEPYLQSIG
jgi:hypothetical protein